MQTLKKIIPNYIRIGNIALLFLFFALFLTSSHIYSQLTTQDVAQENLDIIEEFSFESNELLFPDQSYTPISTFNGITYLVWVNTDRYPMVAKMENGQVETARLDNNDSYKPLENGHNKFSIGVDEDGYIHVTGDMHNYPDAVVGHLPDEYLGGKCMYWVSDNPGDISSFTWQGKSNQSIQGTGHTYHSFFNDNNGVLYYGSRANTTGVHQGYNLERYDTNTKTWRQLGEKPNPNRDLKLVAWGADGRSYQGMRGDIRFDRNNRMHLTVIVRNGTGSNPDGGGAKSASGVIYAYSDDGGETFHKADGTAVSLPMWTESGSNQADVLIEGQEWISMPASVAFNQYNEPFVHYTYTLNNNDTARYTQWDHDSGWGTIRDLPLNAFGWDRQYNDGRGVITLSSLWTDEFYRTVDLNGDGVLYNTSFVCVDRRYLKDTGELRGLSKSSSNGNTILKVVRLETSLPKVVEMNIPNNYDAAPQLQQVSNNVGSGGSSVASSGVINTGNTANSTYGLNTASSINLSDADEFTVTWAVNNASIGNVNNINANGWFFGVTANTNATGTTNNSLWNEAPEAIGVVLYANGTNDMSFVESEGTNQTKQSLGNGAPNVASLEDGFMITLTVSKDNGWTAVSSGLSSNFNASGELDVLDFEDVANNLVAFTSIHGDDLSYRIDRVSLGTQSEDTSGGNGNNGGNGDDGKIVHIRKRNDTSFAIDGNHGGDNLQNVYLWSSNTSNENQQWVEIDRGNGYYSYQKIGTNFCIDGNNDGDNGQSAYLYECGANNQNQHWKKVLVDGSYYRLEKRNASSYALDGGNPPAADGQDLYIWTINENNQNQHWVIEEVQESIAKQSDVSNNISIYPNPFSNILTIDFTTNTLSAKVTVVNATGQRVLSKDITNGTNTVDFSNFSTGIYFLRISDGQDVYFRKVMKQ